MAAFIFRRLCFFVPVLFITVTIVFFLIRLAPGGPFDGEKNFPDEVKQRILERYGGGGIHFCGRADHCIDLMTDSPNLTMVNMSQPHLNDMRLIYDATIGRGIALKCRPTEEMEREFDLSRGLV